MLRKYYELIKPGIIRGNLLTATAGFFLGARGNVDLWLLLAALIGIALLIASASVFNNYIDKDIDKKMKRTKHRALASGTISIRNALSYGTVLGLAGFAVLIIYTNLLTVLLGLLAMFFYIVVYGYAKRHSEHGTLIGSISGALPPVAGYTAGANQLDIAAGLLFLILVFWQMPHFYAIAIFRMKEYKRAKIPVLPLKRGMPATKSQMFFYMFAFAITSLLLTTFGYLGYVYLLVMAVISLWWLRLALQGFKTGDNVVWSKKIFGFSLIVLLVFSTAVVADSLVL